MLYVTGLEPAVPDVAALTVASVGGGYHDAQVGRGAGAGDDGGAEEAGGGELAARAQPQHLEVAHLAGDAVPLAAPCIPRVATARQPRPRAAARPERDSG